MKNRLGQMLQCIIVALTFGGGCILLEKNSTSLDCDAISGPAFDSNRRQGDFDVAQAVISDGLKDGSVTEISRVDDENCKGNDTFNSLLTSKINDHSSAISIDDSSLGFDSNEILTESDFKSIINQATGHLTNCFATVAGISINSARTDGGSNGADLFCTNETSKESDTRISDTTDQALQTASNSAHFANNLTDLFNTVRRISVTSKNTFLQYSQHTSNLISSGTTKATLSVTEGQTDAKRPEACHRNTAAFVDFLHLKNQQFFNPIKNRSLFTSACCCADRC